MPSPYSVTQYITDLRAIRSTGSATAETSFYPPLDQLLNTIGQSLKPPVLFSTQLRNQGAGMPDGGFFPQTNRPRRNATPPILQNPERGVVEIKPADYNLDALAQEPQVLGYLEQYGLLLITNLREFRLLQLDGAGTVQTLERYTLATTAAVLWTAPLASFARHNELLPDFLARIMLYRAPLAQPKDVAWLLASYAREARARAEDHPLASFAGVKAALQESLGMEFEGDKGEHFFRSTLVQTLFYGIFSAWILWRRSPDGRAPNARFNWRLADDFLKVPILRKLFREVSDRTPLNAIQLTEILELAGEALNRVLPSFFETFREEEAVSYFYEPFLEAFDPQLRKELGVWYTPKEIVRYMVERVDHLLRTQLDQPLGLASPSVRILDPCCGTGAYLTEVLHRIHRTLLEQAGDDNALVPHDLRTAALMRVFGFEIMPAPFVIAHLQLASLLENAGAPITDSQRAGVFLTNALTGWVPERHPQSVIFEEFRREREQSENIKQHGNILVILGNPPYNGYAGIAKIEEERDLTLAYRSTIEGLPAPQGQGLNDLYIRFFRIAERRIAMNDNGRGIISFISNYGWLDGLSHTTMRHHYLHTFQQLFIDNLNGDKYRTGKTTPDGDPDPSAFSTPQNREGIQVGTAISTLVRTGNLAPGVIKVRDLWGIHKLDQLESEARLHSEPQYTTIRPVNALGLQFADRQHSSAYITWPRITELFHESFPGIKTSRDALLVDIERDRLEARMAQYFSNTISDTELAEIVPCAMASSARFNAVQTRRALQERGFRPWQVIRHTYRPFDQRWVYWEPTTKLLDEKREQFVSVRVPNDIALVFPRQNRVTVDGPLVAYGWVDLNLADGGATAFPAHVVPENSLTNSGVQPNLNNNVLALFNGRESLPREIVLHAVATLHSPAYLHRNRGALRRDWPRIPLPGTTDLLQSSSELGGRLASLLDADSTVNFESGWTFLAALRIPTNLGLDEALKLTAGWGNRGQGSTVMPRRGNAIGRAWTDVELQKLAVVAAAEGLTVDDAVRLLGESCVNVHINGESFWTAVPSNVWDYTLGGYQVLKKWLSYREFPLLGRPLHAEEASYFSQVVRRITAILLMGPALDASYEQIAATAVPLSAADRRQEQNDL